MSAIDPRGEASTPGSNDPGQGPGGEGPRSAPAPVPGQWVCRVCGWVYDETAGDPDSGIAPGTPFALIPEDWRCPECGVGKQDFALLAVTW